jgi:hypothetical protein
VTGWRAISTPTPTASRAFTSTSTARPSFEEVAGTLGALPEMGDGIVAGTCIRVQRKYWSPPEVETGGKYVRL